MFADYGRSPVKAVKRIVKRVGKVVGTPITVVRKVAKGDIKGATRTLLTNTNPVAATTYVLTSSKRKLDWARLTFPTSVVAIENRDLRKKAAIGYAVAAVVAGAAFAITAGAATAATTAAGTGAAGAGTAATGTGLTAAAATASKVAGAADLLAKLKKKKDGEVEEDEVIEKAEIPTQQELKELKEIKLGSTTKYWIIGGAVVLLIGGLIYYAFSETTEKIAA